MNDDRSQRDREAAVAARSHLVSLENRAASALTACERNDPELTRAYLVAAQLSLDAARACLPEI